MNAKTFFKIIDYSMNPVQNAWYTPFVKKNNIHIIKDIVYDDEYKDIRCGDIYFKTDNPDNLYDSLKSVKRPVFINIHGGGFVAGDKKFRRYFSAYIANLGFVVFNINYGVGPEHKFPFCLQSIAKAITWVSENANEYGFDTTRLILSGDSAGANLAALGGVISTTDGFADSIGAKKPPVKPSGLLLYCGPYDINTTMQNKTPFNIVEKVLFEASGYTKDNITEFKYYNDFSPLPYLTDNFPPTFIVYAEKDIFCKNHSQILIKALQEKNIKVDSFHSNTILDNHCFHLNHSFKLAKEAMLKSEQFLRELFDF